MVVVLLLRILDVVVILLVSGMDVVMRMMDREMILVG